MAQSERVENQKIIRTKPTANDISEWLQQKAIAKGGGIFRPSSSKWRPDPTTYSANIAEAKKAVSEFYQPWLIVALVFRAKEISARALCRLSGTLKLCADNNLNILDIKDVILVHQKLDRTQHSILRSFLKYWVNLELDVSPSSDVVDSHYQLKPKSRSRCPVESMDPEKGPYTELEVKSLFDWVNDSFSHGNMDITSFILLRMLILTGSRRRQIQQLVFGDILLDGREYYINMPKAKSKSVEFRGDFQRIVIPDDDLRILLSYKRHTIEYLEEKRPGFDWNRVVDNIPLFRVTRGEYSLLGANETDLVSLSNSPNVNFHMSDASMKGCLLRLNKSADIPISERTGKRIHLSSHRFRYTLGTDMAREGYTAHAIARALSHTNIRSVGRYIKTSPEMGKRLSEKMKSELSLVVNAFQGVIIPAPSEMERQEKRDKVIRGGAKEIATCGSMQGCHLDAPVACYTCSKFQPWIDAPHEEVLKRLEDRQRKASEGAFGNNSYISFERPILAVKQVIDSIKDIKRREKKGAL